jgi:hypothetical protein
MTNEENKIPWYKRKEIIGAALTVVSAGLKQFETYTVAYKVGFVIGIGLTAYGLKKGYQADNLPSGLSDAMDKIPNTITGVRGINKVL